MDLMHILDLLSIFAFALVGARIAADRGLDYGGIAFIAIIASISGGTLRNVFLGILPIWIRDPWVLLTILVAVLITLTIRRVTYIGGTLLALDTFGLAFATMSGSQLAHDMDIPWFAVIMMGAITAVTGGLLRDVLCQVEPVLLHRETIGTSALGGASIYAVLINSGIDSILSVMVGGAIVIGIRVASIKFDLHLPKFNKGS